MNLLRNKLFLKKFSKYLTVGVSSMVLLFSAQVGVLGASWEKGPEVAQATLRGYCEDGWRFIGNAADPTGQNDDAGDNSQWIQDPSCDSAQPQAQVPNWMNPMPVVPTGTAPCEIALASGENLCSDNITFCEDTGNGFSTVFLKHQGACEPTHGEADSRGCVFVFTPLQTFPGPSCKIPAPAAPAQPVQQPQQPTTTVVSPQQQQQQQQQPVIIQQPIAQPPIIVVQPPIFPQPPFCTQVFSHTQCIACNISETFNRNTCSGQLISLGKQFDASCSGLCSQPPQPPVVITPPAGGTTNVTVTTGSTTVTTGSVSTGAVSQTQTVNPTLTSTREVTREVVREVPREVRIVEVAGVKAEVKELPKTGLPALAWAVAFFIPAGFGLRKFGKSIKENLTANYLWEERQFQARS